MHEFICTRCDVVSRVAFGTRLTRCSECGSPDVRFRSAQPQLARRGSLVPTGAKTKIEEGADAASLGGRTCPGCGAAIGDDARFCPQCGADVRSAVRRTIEDVTEKECPECGAGVSATSESCARCGYEFAARAALIGRIERMLDRPGPSQSLDPRPGESVAERDARHRQIRAFGMTGGYARPLRTETSRGPRPIYALSAVPGACVVVGHVLDGFDAFEQRTKPVRFLTECERIERVCGRAW